MDYVAYRWGCWMVGAVLVGALGCGSDGDGEDTVASGSGGGSATETTESTVGAETEAASTGDLSGPVVCDDPVELAQPSGAPSGFVQCANGLIERVAAVECEPVDIGSCVQGGSGSDCSTAADCGEGSVCTTVGGGPGVFCQCRSTCRVDADCGEGSICGCAPLDSFPRCIPSSCATTDSCNADPDSFCAVARATNGCNVRYAGACTGEDDACSFTSDCGEQEACLPTGESWGCQFDSCE